MQWWEMATVFLIWFRIEIMWRSQDKQITVVKRRDLSDCREDLRLYCSYGLCFLQFAFFIVYTIKLKVFKLRCVILIYSEREAMCAWIHSLCYYAHKNIFTWQRTYWYVNTLIFLKKSCKSNYFLSLLLPFVAKVIIVSIPLEVQKAKTCMEGS